MYFWYIVVVTVLVQSFSCVRRCRWLKAKEDLLQELDDCVMVWTAWQIARTRRQQLHAQRLDLLSVHNMIQPIKPLLVGDKRPWVKHKIFSVVKFTGLANSLAPETTVLTVLARAAVSLY